MSGQDDIEPDGELGPDAFVQHSDDDEQLDSDGDRSQSVPPTV